MIEGQPAMTNAQVAMLSACTLLAGGNWAGQPTALAKQFKDWMDENDES